MRKVKIKVPTELKDIKLSQYQKFLRATEDVEDESLIQRYMVEIFCDIPESVVRNMTPKSFNETFVTINNIFKDMQPDLVRTFVYEDIEYGFIPNFDDITLGEQIDIDNNIKDWQNTDVAMGVLYRPIKTKHKEKYNIVDYEANGKKLDVSLDVALGAYFFLQNLQMDLLTAIPNFIEDQVMQNPKLLSLVKNGVGLQTFTDSLNVLSLSMKKTLQTSS